MEALERSLRSFGIECARRHMMRGEIIEQGSGDGGLADASLIRADQNQCWFSHDPPLTTKLVASPSAMIFTQRLENWKARSHSRNATAMRLRKL
jgi:hypothetical protein